MSDPARPGTLNASVRPRMLERAARRLMAGSREPAQTARANLSPARARPRSVRYTEPIVRLSFGSRTISSAAVVARAAVISVLAVSLAASPCVAQQPPLPKFVGYVNDFADVLAPDAEARLDDLARRLNLATRGDLVVVTLPDLAGRPVEEVALRLGREWKVGANAAIGDAARNAGIVLLIVPKETALDGRGRCRIEVGQGAEGFITDATSGELCRSVRTQFEARDYGGAIEFVALTIADRYASAFGVTVDGRPRESSRPARGSNDRSQLILLLLVFVVVPMVLRAMGRRRTGCLSFLPLLLPGPGRGGSFGGSFGGGFGGGSGGGGFGGFGGGGGFSGGGGGSDW